MSEHEKLKDHCAKHGSHPQGECPQCDELAEARSIVATTYIPPATLSSKTVTCVECIGENGPMTPEQCAQWLDAKWTRHGELEDKASAQMIRNLVTTAQGMREDYRRLREALERGRDYLQGEFYAEALGILDDALSGDSSQDETKALLPCWCPYCGEPHSPAVRETRSAPKASGDAP